MKITLAVALAVLLTVILGAAGVYWVYQNQKAPQELSPSPLPSPIEKFPSSKEGSALGTKTPSIQPVAGTNTVPIPDIEIIVTSPADGKTISSPVKVSGRANVFEEILAIYIKDSNGNILGQGQASACEDINACNFEASVVFAKPQTANGTVEVFVNSEQNRKDYLQIIPVTF
ncbi:Gmad2 immunoglobulin-like domain-containing protein [Candidatus Curtissbacteria bacterium]|nr:Gmad2 immunoglobulin-like domain-containing protein [Candidatus Curtissbacteria bacterium]